MTMTFEMVLAVWNILIIPRFSTILMLVLVILIALMAVILFLRLNRS